jgi:hypothetical protein
MYHIWIHPLCCSLSYSLPQFPEQSQQVSFLLLLTCVYITWTTLPPPGRTFFCSVVLQFCRTKTIKDNKKNMAFLRFILDIVEVYGYFIHEELSFALYYYVTSGRLLKF